MMEGKRFKIHQILWEHFLHSDQAEERKVQFGSSFYIIDHNVVLFFLPLELALIELYVFPD